MASLLVLGVAKHFGQAKVLESVDLTVASGEVLAVLGASGSGKTSLLRLIAGFERVDGGSIEIGGERVSGPALHVPPERRRVGYVPQHGALFPHLTVAENIGFGLPRAQRRPGGVIAGLLNIVGLPEGHATRMPRQLSGGEQQRVAVARALAPQPKLVLLDEPFSALDANSRAETRVAVAAALRASGSTAILVTHDQAEAFSAGSQVAILRAGRIAQIAPPEELYRNPADAGIAAFLGDANILPGLARGGIVSCALGNLPAAGGVEGEVEILIRPEQIRLATPEAGEGIRATVTGITYFGADALVALALNPDISLSARVFGQNLPPVGAEIVLHVEGGVTVFTEPADQFRASTPGSPLGDSSAGVP